MKPLQRTATFLLAVALSAALGCAATRTQESTGEYIDDAVITTKVKAALFNEPSLRSAEFSVDTFKGVVLLGGFVGSQANVITALNAARSVAGVKSVRDGMQLR